MPYPSCQRIKIWRHSWLPKLTYGKTLTAKEKKKDDVVVFLNYWMFKVNERDNWCMILLSLLMMLKPSYGSGHQGM
jgi:hypothetical protein